MKGPPTTAEGYKIPLFGVFYLLPGSRPPHLPWLQLYSWIAALRFGATFWTQKLPSPSQAALPIKGCPHFKEQWAICWGAYLLGHRCPRPVGLIGDFNGYIKFRTLPPHGFIFSKSTKSAQGQSDLQNALNHLLSQGVVVPVPPYRTRCKGFCSHLVWCKNPMRALVLSWPLNH